MNKFKKLYTVSIAITGILSILLIIFWIYYFIDYKERNSITELTFYKTDIENYYSNEEVDLNKFILPSYMNFIIEEEEWSFYFSTKDIEKIIDSDMTSDLFSDGLGVTLFTDKIVFIEVKGNKDQSLRTFYHELGHLLDNYYGISTSLEWINIYNKYKDSYEYPYKVFGVIKDTYPNSNPEEFFATVHEAYTLYPDYLKKEAPDAFNYIDMIVNSNKDILSTF